MSADEEWTCGKGLAASAGVPAQLGELMETATWTLGRWETFVGTSRQGGFLSEA